MSPGLRLRPFAPCLRALVSLGLLVPIAACVDSTALESGLAVPTGVLVDPLEFLGDVSCSARPGGMQAYVGTLYDVIDPANPFPLASSPPTACSLGTDYRFVVEGHPYVAEIDGYEESALALSPLGGLDSGSRHMVLGDGTTVVPPRWSGACGVGGEVAIASFDVDVVIRACEPLTDHAGASATGIEVDPAITLPTPGSCVADAGDVVTFDVTPQSADLMPEAGLVCSPENGNSTMVYDVGVQPGADYTFDVVARDATGAAIGTAQCFASATAGLVVLAACDALNP